MKNNIIFFLVTSLVTSFIVFTWFSDKTFISNNSEENLNFTNFERTAQHYSTNWMPIGTGALNVFGFVRYPYLKFLSFFHELGFEPFLIQAFSYWIIMILGVNMMYLLLYKGFYLNRSVSIIGSLFYLLNIYSMTQVWKRNLYQGMFPWAYLPLFIFLWIKWLNKGKIYWLIPFILSVSLFSSAFAHPSYFFVCLVSAGVFAFLEFKKNWNDKNLILKIFLRCIIAFLLGILVNGWWLYPLTHNSTAGGSMVDIVSNQWKANLDSLAGVSKYFGTFDILLLRQKAYFEKDSPLSTEWFFFYDNLLTILISLALFLIMVRGVLKNKTNIYFKYLFTLLIIGWFVSKGTNIPLGNLFYTLLFSNFPLAAALRNPYEKFGIVFLIPYSTFFALGLYDLASKINAKRRGLFISLLMIIFCGILVYPMWNGEVFTRKERLNIPANYIQANIYLNQNLSKRSFHIPFSIQAELLKYTWGYIGEEASENLFDSQNVSRSGVPIFDNYYLLIPKLLPNAYLPRVLGLLGVDHIILHNDMIYPKLDLNVVRIDQWQEIRKDKEFGLLTLYKLDDNIIKPEIYASISVIRLNSLEEALDKISRGEFDASNDIFMTTNISFNTNINSSLPDILFKKISINGYEVRISNAQDSFILVLNQTLHPFWEARIGSELIKQHFLVNGFANGWLIDRKGDYIIKVFFRMWPWE